MSKGIKQFGRRRLLASLFQTMKSMMHTTHIQYSNGQPWHCLAFFVIQMPA